MFIKRRRITAPLWGALGIVVGLAMVFIFMAPRLVDATPAPESETDSASPTIRITFSRPMDQDAVESSLSFEPPRSGSITWEDQTLVFRPDQPWEHGQSVQVRLAGGARSIRWLPLLGARTWAFTIGEPRFLFLFPADSRADLYLQAVDSIVPTQLTTTEFGIEEYSRSRDGEFLVYSQRRGDGGSDFYLFDLERRQGRLLYACPIETICQAPALSPDNAYLAFDQAEYSISETGRRIAGPSRVMLMNLSAETEPQVVSDMTHIASTPLWSPDGLLAFYDNSLRAVVLIDPQAENINAINYLPNNVGLVGDWSTDGDHLILADILLRDPSGSENTDGIFLVFLNR